MTEYLLARYLSPLRRDIQVALAWSEDRFGSDAAERYGELIYQSLRDDLDQPRRLGARAHPDLPPHVYVYHLMHSSDRVTGERVKTPRHFLLDRFVGNKLEFGCLLHDSRNLTLHVPKAFGVKSLAITSPALPSRSR